VFPAGLVLFLFLLFPDGHLPTRRWRVLGWMAVVTSVAMTVLVMIDPTPISVGPNLATVPNPVGVAGAPKFNGNSAFGNIWLLAICELVAAAVAMGLRLRRSRGVERRQLKLSAYAGVFSVGLVVVTVLAQVIFGDAVVQGWFDLAIILGFGIAVPVSCAVAILRYGLYDIDVVISKTVVVGILAVFITVVYLAVVVGIGAVFGSSSGSGTFLAVVATALIAIAFQPVRIRARRLADRIVYGERATPYEVLSQFSERVAGAYAGDDILPTMARVLGEGTGARTADVWLCVGRSLRRAASWSPNGGVTAGGVADLVTGDGGELPPIEGASIAVPVSHQGELLGALSLRKPSAEPLTGAEDKLVRDLAAQAGLVLRNARLTAELRQRLEELQASRQRIVAAQDQERRRLERNIHDGAQQQLVAMAVKLRLANQLTAKDPERARELLDDLGTELTQAMNDLRDLARGIYPPLLSDRGLVAALDAQARKAPFSVTIEAGSVPRYSQDIEAAVYFCCLEALQNASKYAAATSVRIDLECTEDRLTFRVTDDGRGFDPASSPQGSGLLNMADRVEALGGDFEIESAPGHGTTVTGRIPVEGPAVPTPAAPPPAPAEPVAAAPTT
jgi:signal transduction histidine kinase